MTDLRTLLSEVVSYNDARAEEHGVKDLLQQMGMDDYDAVTHVAEQRVMRMILVAEGLEINEQNMRSVLRYPARRAMLQMMLPVFLDALACGWEAQKRIQEGRA